MTSGPDVNNYWWRQDLMWTTIDDVRTWCKQLLMTSGPDVNNYWWRQDLTWITIDDVRTWCTQLLMTLCTRASRSAIRYLDLKVPLVHVSKKKPLSPYQRGFLLYTIFLEHLHTSQKNVPCINIHTYIYIHVFFLLCIMIIFLFSAWTINSDCWLYFTT